MSRNKHRLVGINPTDQTHFGTDKALSVKQSNMHDWTNPDVKLRLPQIVQTAQNSPYGGKYKILSNILTSFFKRSQFCFKLDAMMIVKVNILIYEEASLLIGLKLCAINALGFEN